MASDAKGQLGGIDMNEESRRLLATQSRSWKCNGCASKTNSELIAECEAQWREAQEQNPGAKGPDNSIPEELRLAYKDDMERGPPTPMTANNAENASQDVRDGVSRSPSLPVARAGPVANVLARSKPPPSPLRATSSASEALQERNASQTPGTSSLRNTQNQMSTASALSPARTSMPPTATLTVPQTTRQASQSSAAVPKWVDIAIVVLGIIIAYLAIGKVFT